MAKLENARDLKSLTVRFAGSSPAEDTKMQFTDEEIETIKVLIEDRGFEYSLKSELVAVVALARKLKMREYVKMYEPMLD